MRGTYDRSLSDRGSWFDRSQQGQPTEEGGPPNGNISPRKGYTRAPFDDWRKPTATAGGDEQEQDQAGGGWRSGPSSSGRRWNAPPGGAEPGRGGGWRTVSDDRSRYNNQGQDHREYQNGSSSRWHRETNEEPYNRGGRGGFSAGRGFSRGRSRQDSDLPEWASEDLNAADLSGGFDSSGKFSSGLDNKPKRVINLNRDLRGNGVENEKNNEDEAFEDEEVDVDDLPENARKEPMEVQAPSKKMVHEVQAPPPVVQQQNEQVMDNKVQQDLHDQMTNDFVSKLIEDDEPHSEAQAPTSTPQAAGPPPSQVHLIFEIFVHRQEFSQKTEMSKKS